jgi:hypothetical protein
MSSDLKIPHMGWNKTVNKDNPLFKNLQNPYLQPENRDRHKNPHRRVL